ncbi:sulfate/molybdate ABC transporter ATP-binding protein [Aquimarina addita]|uniref:Sulfate/molybdate ABC transporter ATP-binding protein n=1 Tax=Aquimarina addita TaxID=870485 RepID=A0ABP6USN1_9FLAO
MIAATIHKTLQAADTKLQLDIQLQVEKGQFVALYGASGVGKTSVLRILAGLLSVDKGQLSVHNTTWVDTAKKINYTPQQRNIGYVFQEYALFPNMTVRKNLEFALEKGQDRSIIDELIDLIELKKLEDRKPVTLSGGQQQRVALARALVRRPEILLLDEPLSALDIKMRTKLQDYILKVHKQYQLTTILVSHDAGEIIKMADHLICLEDGKISKQGSPIALFTNNQLSGTFQCMGEVVKIVKEEVVCILSVFINGNVIKMMAEESEVSNLSIGDKVMVTSKMLNPLLVKINE